MKTTFFFLLTLLSFGISPKPDVPKVTVTMSKMVLQDKIKGSWAGQLISCTGAVAYMWVRSLSIFGDKPILAR